MKYTLQQRFYMFLATAITMVCLYQGYNVYQSNIYIDKTLSKNNKTTTKYTQMYLEVYAENTELKKQVSNLRTSFYTYQAEIERLEKQVDLVNDYWKNEYNKVNNELFDLKNTKLRVNKEGKGGEK